jgi:hypothetical protein
MLANTLVVEILRQCASTVRFCMGEPGPEIPRGEVFDFGFLWGRNFNVNFVVIGGPILYNPRNTLPRHRSRTWR